MRPSRAALRSSCFDSRRAGLLLGRLLLLRLEPVKLLQVLGLHLDACWLAAEHRCEAFGLWWSCFSSVTNACARTAPFFGCRAGCGLAACNTLGIPWIQSELEQDRLELPSYLRAVIY